MSILFWRRCVATGKIIVMGKVIRLVSHSKHTFSLNRSLSNVPICLWCYRPLHLMTELKPISGRLYSWKFETMDNVQNDIIFPFWMLHKSFLDLSEAFRKCGWSMLEGASSHTTLRRSVVSDSGNWVLIRILGTSVVQLNTCRHRRRR
jgi:hypothetical protein